MQIQTNRRGLIDPPVLGFILGRRPFPSFISFPLIFTFPLLSRVSHVTIAFPSSSINLSITSDSIDPLLSDFTPSEVTESQSTAPIISEPPPPSIERVGPDREKEQALWSDMSKTKFIKWWLTTQYGLKPKGERPHWDKRGYTSELWHNFDQVAHIKTG